MTRIGKSPFHDRGDLSLKSLRGRVEQVYDHHHNVWIWHHAGGAVAIKQFMDEPAFHHSVAIHERVNHLPIFPRIYGQARLDGRPTLMMEAYLPPHWIDGLLGGGRWALRAAAPGRLNPVVMGVVTGAGLLHAHGIVEDTNGFEHKFFYNLASGAVRLYDAEEWRLEGAPASLASPTFGIDDFLGAYGFAGRPPDVPLPAWDGHGLPIIRGTSRYVLSLAAPCAEAGVRYDGTHFREDLPFSPRHPSPISRRADYALFCWPADRLNLRDNDILFRVILNKIRPGGMAVLTAKHRHLQLEQLATATRQRSSGPAPTAWVIESEVAPRGTLLIRKLRATYT